jgi:hypothetical protein
VTSPFDLCRECREVVTTDSICMPCYMRMREIRHTVCCRNVSDYVPPVAPKVKPPPPAPDFPW